RAEEALPGPSRLAERPPCPCLRGREAVPPPTEASTGRDQLRRQRPGPRQHRVAGRAFDPGPLQVGGHRPGTSLREWPDDGDVVAGIGAIAASLFAYPPAVADPGAQAVVAGGVVDQP